MVLLVCGLILAGCTQPQTQYVCPDGSVVSAAAECELGEEAPMEEPESYEWNLENLKSLNSPIKCESKSMMYVDHETTHTFYILGDNVRVETYTEGFDGNPDPVIFKGELLYETTFILTNVPEGCDWYLIDETKLTECTNKYSPGLYGFDILVTQLASEVSCKSATFGDEVFDTSGTVCDLSEELCEFYESR